MNDEPALPGTLDVRSVALTLLAVLASIVLLQQAQSLVIPIVLGLLISYALYPVVSWLAGLHVPRPIGAAIVLLLLVGLGGLGLYQLRPQVDAIVRELPSAARQLRQSFERTRAGDPSTLRQVQQAAAELERAASAASPSDEAVPPGVTRVRVEEPALEISSYLMTGSLTVVTATGQAVLVLFLAYFLLASGDLYRRKLVKIAGPSLTKKKITVQILDDIDRQIAHFLLVQVATSVIVGVASWAAFRWLGLNQAATWGLIAGVFNSIPYVGPVIVTGGISTVAFLQFGTLAKTLTIATAALVITSLEGFLLTPWLTSRAAQMNAVAVFVGLLFWGWVWDVWGMLLAVPILVVIKSICDRIEDFKSVGELLGE